MLFTCLDEHNSGELLKQVKHPVILKELEIECNKDKEADLKPTHLTAPLEEHETEKYLAKLPQCEALKSSQAPENPGGLADSALEDDEHNSGELLKQVKYPVLLKELEIECNKDKEAHLKPTHLTAPLEEHETEKYLVKLPQFKALESSQAPEIPGGLADSALEDGESRSLACCNLLFGHECAVLIATSKRRFLTF
ncbi:uncharacterized protein LOC144798441 [Lissotriton helveticus]